MTNCVNCGAPLSGSKCTYCGTEYNDRGVVCTLSEEDCTGTLCVGGKEYQGYLGNMEGHLIAGPNTGRDLSGRLHIDRGKLKHKFTLIEL